MVHFAQLTNTLTTDKALRGIDGNRLTAMVCLNDDISGDEGDAVDEMLAEWYATHWSTPSVWEESLP